MYFVYELVEPRNNATGYIGITNNPNQRYLEHVEGRAGKGKKYEWIKRLQQEGTQPKMKILEIVDDLAQAREQERYWIQQYLSKGTQLVNTVLIHPPKKEEKRIFRGLGKRRSKEQKHTAKTPPYGYITSTEASRRLNVSESMMRRYAQQGKIGYLLPPGRKQGFYLEKDVDDIVNDLNEFYARAKRLAAEE